MSAIRTIIIFLIIFIMGITTYAAAQNIVYITRENETYFDPNYGDYSEYPFLATLEGVGYSITKMYNSVTELSAAGQATIDSLNNADLVILGRSTPSDMYDGADKPFWNALTVPVLNLSVWSVRNTRLNWFNSTATTNIDESVDYNAIIELPEDPVFEGIDTGGDVPWCFGPVSFLEEVDAGNGTVLARESENSWVLFVRFEEGVEFYDGSGDVPAGPRTIIGNGNDNLRDENNAHVFNFYNFTTESEQVFLAEVARMAALGGATSVEDKQPTAPLGFNLDQNYPNPFNPATKIEFTLIKADHTILEIYNALGQSVATLINGHMNSGRHDVTFMADGLTSGIYFYKLTSGNFTEMKKMILMK